MQEKTLEEEFWKMLEDNRFIQSTNSITDEIEEIEGAIVDMEAIVKINGEFDKYDIEKWLTNAIEKAREEGRKEGQKEYILNKINERIAVTQYKEDLLSKLPEENSIYEIDRMMVNDNKYIAGKFVGFNECLSAVKKLL